MSRINNEPTVFGHPNFFTYSPEKSKEAEQPKDIHLQIEEAAKALEEISPIVQKNQSRTPYILLGVALAALAALGYQNYSLSQQVVPPAPATPSFTPACKSLSECWKFDPIECQNLLHQLFGTTNESELSQCLNNPIDQLYSYFAKTPDQIQVDQFTTFDSGTSYLNAIIQLGCQNTLLYVDFSNFSDLEIKNGLIAAARSSAFTNNEKLIKTLSQIIKDRNIFIEPYEIYQMLWENSTPNQRRQISVRNEQGIKESQFSAIMRYNKQRAAKCIIQQDFFNKTMRYELKNIAQAILDGNVTDKNKAYNTLQHFYMHTPNALKEFFNEHPEYREAFETHAKIDPRIQMNKYSPTENLAHTKV